MKTNESYKIFLLTLAGMLGSIIAGFIFYNTHIFNPAEMKFQFVIAGLYGSAFYAIAKYKRAKQQSFVIIIIFIFQVVVFTGRSLSLPFIIRDFYGLSALFISVRLYLSFQKKYSYVKYYLRTLALVLLYTIINVVFMILVFITNSGQIIPDWGFIIQIARDSILLSFGMGMGLDAYLQNENRVLNYLIK